MERISKPKVMQSAAGYYIGTALIDEDGHEQPYERLSGYFPNHEMANDTLKNGDY